MSAQPPSRTPGLRILPAAVTFLALFSGVNAGPWEQPAPMVEPGPFLFWDTSLTVRAGLGYKDNPLLSPNSGNDTAISQLGADLFVTRLPVDDHAFNLFVSLDDRRYLDEVRSGPGQPRADKEQLFLASAEYHRSLTGGWRPGLAVVAYHAEQVYDASDFGGQPGTVRARGKVATATPSVRYTRDAWSLELQFTGGHFWFDPPVSGYAEYGPRLVGAWRPATNTVLELSWNWTARPFDSRSQTDILGTPLTGTRLTNHDLRTQLEWRQTWDAGRRFQTSARLLHLRRTENGEGFSDYDRLGAVAGMTLRLGRWQLRGTGRWSTYDFAFQIVSPFQPVPRTREEIGAEARIECRLGEPVRLYAEYAYEEQRSNVPSDNFRAQTGLLGIEYDF